jgi:hypothetical protein
VSSSHNEHFRQLHLLSGHMDLAGLTLYEHHYRYLGFGSFTIELGQPHKRLQYKWDGKERFLVCSTATLSGQGENPQWKEFSTLELPADNQPLAFIKATLDEHFAI